MGKVSKISWCDATWNPWRGCHPVSPACDNCYAAAFAKIRPKLFPGGFGTLVRSKTTFNDPLKWDEPRRIFVCSLSDFFHPEADQWREDAWGVIHEAHHHTYLILTKRPTFMALDLLGWSQPSYVWLGVTAENQQQADKRIPILIDTPAAVRFISIEPMLGPVDLSAWFPLPSGQFLEPHGRQADLNVNRMLHWVIVGGESGPSRRPMKIEWLEDIVDQCRAAGVPVFVKQGNALHPGQQGAIPDELWQIKEMPE